MGLVFQAVVPLPGGAGAGELGFGGLYGWFGGSEATGVLASLVRRVVEWGIGLGGYLVYLRLRAGLPAPVPAPAEPVPACAEG
jgi:hypothetical protein